MSGLQIATGIRVAKKKKKLNPFTAVQYPPTSRDYKNVLNFFNRQVRNALCPNLFQLFGSGYTITGITECFNPGLVSAFNDKRQRLAEQQKTAPDLFKNQQWRLLSNVADREYVYNRFEQRLNSFLWNKEGLELPIIPVIHATNAVAAKNICKTGFATLSTLDSGFYGQGIYFTTNAEYAATYCISDKPCLILCYLLPGNTYPVIENPLTANSLRGAPLKPGYQSHYVLVDGKGIAGSDGDFDEIVINQDTQVLPAYILHVDPTSIPSIVKRLKEGRECDRASEPTTTPVTKVVPEPLPEPVPGPSIESAPQPALEPTPVQPVPSACANTELQTSSEKKIMAPNPMKLSGGKEHEVGRGRGVPTAQRGGPIAGRGRAQIPPGETENAGRGGRGAMPARGPNPARLSAQLQPGRGGPLEGARGPNPARVSVQLQSGRGGPLEGARGPNPARLSVQLQSGRGGPLEGAPIQSPEVLDRTRAGPGRGIARGGIPVSGRGGIAERGTRGPGPQFQGQIISPNNTNANINANTNTSTNVNININASTNVNVNINTSTNVNVNNMNAEHTAEIPNIAPRATPLGQAPRGGRGGIATRGGRGIPPPQPGQQPTNTQHQPESGRGRTPIRGRGTPYQGL